jgi:hypothetical protein
VARPDIEGPLHAARHEAEARTARPSRLRLTHWNERERVAGALAGRPPTAHRRLRSKAVVSRRPNRRFTASASREGEPSADRLGALPPLVPCDSRVGVERDFCYAASCLLTPSTPANDPGVLVTGAARSRATVASQSASKSPTRTTWARSCSSSQARAATSSASRDARPADATVSVAIDPRAAASLETGRVAREFWTSSFSIISRGRGRRSRCRECASERRRTWRRRSLAECLRERPSRRNDERELQIAQKRKREFRFSSSITGTVSIPVPTAADRRGSSFGGSESPRPLTRGREGLATASDAQAPRSSAVDALRGEAVAAALVSLG